MWQSPIATIGFLLGAVLSGALLGWHLQARKARQQQDSLNESFQEELGAAHRETDTCRKRARSAEERGLALEPLQQQLLERDHALAKLNVELNALRNAPQTVAPQIIERIVDAGDDLKLIPGVGPKLEAVLHSRGVTRFSQIANWQQGDVDQFEAGQSRFKGRIARDGWVASAQREHRKKYGRDA
jgi:predicted flap endonuclease-1-like 5' DNA nuclease